MYSVVLLFLVFDNFLIFCFYFLKSFQMTFKVFQLVRASFWEIFWEKYIERFFFSDFAHTVVWWSCMNESLFIFLSFFFLGLLNQTINQMGYRFNIILLDLSQTSYSILGDLLILPLIADWICFMLFGLLLWNQYR